MPPAQTFARHVLHHDVQDLVHLVGVKRADHVGVVEPPDELHLALKSGHDTLVAYDLRSNDLEGDHTVHHQVMGLVHAPHRTRAEPVENDVAAHHQAMRLAVQEPANLVFGQHLVGDKPLGQGQSLRRIVTPQDLGPHVGQGTLAQNARPANDRDQVDRDILRRQRFFEGRHSTRPVLTLETLEAWSRSGDQDARFGAWRFADVVSSEPRARLSHSTIP